jgi:putative membrane protein
VGAAISDGQILEVLYAVHTAELEQAQVALAKAQSPRVREFATHMITQHNASKHECEQIAAAGGLMRSDSAVSLNLKPRAAEILQTLKSTDAASFDYAYMLSQIQQHDEVLTILTKKLIPAASSPPVRQHATKAQAMVQHPVEQARSIQL